MVSLTSLCIRLVAAPEAAGVSITPPNIIWQTFGDIESVAHVHLPSEVPIDVPRGELGGRAPLSSSTILRQAAVEDLLGRCL